MERAKEWLQDGDKVRAAIAFRGREMTHRELGAKILARLSGDLSEFADVEVAPKMEGYQMFTIFIPKKAGPEAKKRAVPKAAPVPAESERAEPRQQREKAAPAPKNDDEIF
jgi:translation initiation factor IF-3